MASVKTNTYCFPSIRPPIDGSFPKMLAIPQKKKKFLDDKTDPNIQIDLFKLLSSLSLWLSVGLNIVTSDPHLLFWIPWTYTPWRRWPAQSKFVWFKGFWREMNAVFLNPKHSSVNSLWKRSLALRLPFTNSLLKWVCCSPFLCHLH